jgi:hypothetical protein
MARPRERPRQVLGSEDEKGDHEDEDEFLEANVEHDGFR